WFAVDAVGHLGHFSTAGYGPVPVNVLERVDAAHTDDVWSLGEWLLELPVVGMATGHMSGQIDDWLELARPGIFSFDWQHWSGPYRRAATPSVPIAVAALPSRIQHLVRLVEWPGLRFAESNSVSPEDLCTCG